MALHRLSLLALSLSCAALASPGRADILSVPDDHPTIQAAIDAAADGDEILVGPGVWVENIDFSGKDIQVRSSGGSAVTTLQAPGGLGVNFDQAEPATAVFEGFTVTGGSGAIGGGMQIDGLGTDPTVRDCHFTQNANASLGGGIRVTNQAAPRIERCLFTENNSERGAGLGAVAKGAPTIVDCEFYENVAVGVIAEGGGWFFGTEAAATMINCLVYDNQARIGGAGKNRSCANTLFVNCTMAFNRAHHYTGGIWNSDAFPTLVNCILWGNVDPQMPGFQTDIHDSNSLSVVSYSIVEEGFAGVSVSTADPEFVDEIHFDLRLAVTSPGIDAGDTTAVPAGTTVDAWGQTRFVDDPYTADTGVGAAPVVDLGALEFQDACGSNGGPVAYCTGKLNTAGCVPDIAWTGSPSLTGGGFTVEASEVLNLRNGLFFYGLQGRTNLPFQGGVLCVVPPLRRTAIQNSGGALPPAVDCSGQFTYDFLALINSGADPGLVAGAIVDGQYWYRDPLSSNGAGLSNGIELRICP